MIADLKRILHNNKWGFTFICIYFLVAQLLFSYVCPSMWLFGLPCPACGLSRAAWRILVLDFVGAFNYNPAIFLVPFAVYFYVKRRAGLFVVIIALAIVILFVRLRTSFGVEPLIINHNALLFRLLGAGN